MTNLDPNLGTMCHSCGDTVRLDETCKMRIEDTGTFSTYHMHCPEPPVCPDCGLHRNVCEECCEPK